MRAICAKIERIRARGRATLRLERDHPYFRHHGCTFIVTAIGTPGFKCRVTLWIEGEDVEFGIDDLF